MATLRIAFLSALVLELIAALSTALVAVEVGLRLLAGHLGYETALLVLLLAPEAYLPLRAVGAQFHASTEGAAAAADVFAILDTHGARPAGQPGIASGRPAYHPIRLSGVGLSYPGRGRDALSGVSMTIRPGDQITLTGPSGAGKTALFALLLRFAEPTSGRIEAGGTDLAGVPLGGVAPPDRLGPAEPHLFAASVAENIALGDLVACATAVEAAARAAGADGFIRDLPQRYDTAGGRRAEPVLWPAPADRARPRVPA